jgi:hypothetical protein
MMACLINNFWCIGLEGVLFHEFPLWIEQFVSVFAINKVGNRIVVWSVVVGKYAK